MNVSERYIQILMVTERTWLKLMEINQSQVNEYIEPEHKEQEST